MRITWFSQSEYKTTDADSGLNARLYILCFVFLLSLMLIVVELSYDVYVANKIAQRSVKSPHLAMVDLQHNHQYMRSRAHVEAAKRGSVNMQSKDEALKNLQTLRMHNALRFTNNKASDKK